MSPQFASDDQNTRASASAFRASLVAQMVKNLPEVLENRFRSLGWKDLLEKGMATYTPVFLPGEFHGQRNLAGYSPWGLTRLKD